MIAALAEGLVEAPRLSAPAEARRALASCSNSAAAELEPELERGRTRDVLLGLADHSPYLWALIQEDPAGLSGCSSVRRAKRSTRSFRRLASDVTRTRRGSWRRCAAPSANAALLVALADIGGVWDVVAATEALTRFAEQPSARARISSCASMRAPDFWRSMRMRPIPRRLRPGRARARQAGRAELKYSSDVDLIVLYDPAAPSIPPERSRGRSSQG